MFDFIVMPDDGKHFEVTARSRDIRTWEKMNKSHSLHKLQLDMHMGDLERIAYLASVRHGLYTGTFEEFASECDIKVLEEEEERDDENPFPKAASPGT